MSFPTLDENGKTNDPFKKQLVYPQENETSSELVLELLNPEGHDFYSTLELSPLDNNSITRTETFIGNFSTPMEKNYFEKD